MLGHACGCKESEPSPRNGALLKNMKFRSGTASGDITLGATGRAMMMQLTDRGLGFPQKKRNMPSHGERQHDLMSERRKAPPQKGGRLPDSASRGVRKPWGSGLEWGKTTYPKRRSRGLGTEREGDQPPDARNHGCPAALKPWKGREGEGPRAPWV